MAKRILVVDDEPVQRRLLEAALQKGGYEPVCCDSAEAALEIIESGREHSAVILDLMMPGMDGMEFLDRLAERDGPAPVIVQTAKGGIDVVVAAMRKGAFDFVVKPVAPDRLMKTLENAIRYQGIQRSARTRRSNPSQEFGFRDIVTRSPAMEPVIRVARKAAASSIPVLIEGESGVGKELIARAMHGASDRASGRLVTVNCGALPENLVESLLFGHEKGAFTGATEKHVGKFEEANGGTLFLDEIGELPLNLQVKLLRAIQEGEIDPVGARKPVRVDVRLISATNRDLREEVAKGRFREDLYYRLSVLPLAIPPLRERREDIEPLIYHFVKKIAREQDRNNIASVNPDVLGALSQYDWPGNIRELENAIFRAIILSDGDELTMLEFPQIGAQLPGFSLHAPHNETRSMAQGALAQPQAPSLETPEADELQIGSQPETETQLQGRNETKPLASPASPPATSYGMVSLIGSNGECKPIEKVEEEVIRFAIEIYKGRMSEVARRLGIGRSTLYRKLRDLGIGHNN